MALSNRGEKWATISPNLAIWKMTKDLWHPDTNPKGYASLGIAENALMHVELTEYISKNFHFAQSGLTYGDGGIGSRAVRAATARFMNRNFHPIIPIEPDHICMTNGVSSAVEHLSNILADPGDAVLLGQPYFGGFLYSINLRTGTEVVKVAFGDVDPLSCDAVALYESAVQACHAKDQRVAAVMLCNPHNPLGRCYSQDALTRLMRLCNKYKIHLISDEIYAMSVFRGVNDTSTCTGEESLAQSAVPFQPFVSVSSVPFTSIIDPSLVHIVWSLSKDFGSNGVRLGCIVSQHNPELHAALVPPVVYSYASSLSESLATQLLNDDEYLDWYFAENSRRMNRSYSRVAKWAESHGLQYLQGVNAAFFLWIDLGSIFLRNRPTNQRDTNLDKLVNDALLEEKVFLVSGAAFGGEQQGWFRIVFSQPEIIVREVLQRIEKALGLSYSQVDTADQNR